LNLDHEGLECLGKEGYVTADLATLTLVILLNLYLRVTLFKD